MMLQIHVDNLEIIDRCKSINIESIVQSMEHLKLDPKVKEVKD